jgi:hypothetical protein
MGADDHLPAGAALNPSEELGHEADDVRMEGEFRFFEQQGAASVQDCPSGVVTSGDAL